MSHHKAILLSLLILVLTTLLAAPVAAQTEDPGKLVVGGQYVLRSGQQLDGDLGVIGGQAVIEQDATVNGDVLVAGGLLRVAGRINGDVAVFGGAVTLESTATVDGDMVTFGGSVERNPGAVVTGSVREGDALDVPGWRGALMLPGVDLFEPDREITVQQSPGQWLLVMLWRALRTGLLILALAALALVVALFWPKGIERIGRTAMVQPAMALVVGVLSWIVGIGLFVLLTVTICLIPVALVLALVLLTALLLAWVVMGWLVGRKLLAALNLRNTTVVVEAALGTLLLATVYFLLGIIPCMSFVAGALIASFGLGAIVLTRFGTRPYPPQAEPDGAEPGQALALADSDTPSPPAVTRS